MPYMYRELTCKSILSKPERFNNAIPAGQHRTLLYMYTCTCKLFIPLCQIRSLSFHCFCQCLCIQTGPLIPRGGPSVNVGKNKETITHYAKAYKAYKDQVANNFAFNGHHNDHNIYPIMKVYWHITTCLLLHINLKWAWWMVTEQSKSTNCERRYYFVIIATDHRISWANVMCITIVLTLRNIANSMLSWKHYNSDKMDTQYVYQNTICSLKRLVQANMFHTNNETSKTSGQSMYMYVDSKINTHKNLYCIAGCFKGSNFGGFCD